MNPIPYKHIYGKITVSADELRFLNLNKDFFTKQLEKNLVDMWSQVISDVAKVRKKTEVIIRNR
jgi:hypothetical protein